MIISTLSFIISLLAILLNGLVKTKRHYSLLFGLIGLCLSFIAVANSYPRNLNVYNIDYIGIIVSILGIIVAVLVGLQLYNVFRLKEDADEVKQTVEQLEEYKKAYENLKQNMDRIKKDMVYYEDIQKDLVNKASHAVYFDYEDEPCDPK